MSFTITRMAGGGSTATPSQSDKPDEDDGIPFVPVKRDTDAIKRRIAEEARKREIRDAKDPPYKPRFPI